MQLVILYFTIRRQKYHAIVYMHLGLLPTSAKAIKFMWEINYKDMEGGLFKITQPQIPDSLSHYL